MDLKLQSLEGLLRRPFFEEVYKVETVGDAYIAGQARNGLWRLILEANLPLTQKNHPTSAARIRVVKAFGLAGGALWLGDGERGSCLVGRTRCALLSKRNFG